MLNLQIPIIGSFKILWYLDVLGPKLVKSPDYSC